MGLENKVLEFFTHEEGRARNDGTQTTGEATAFHYDYFLKDHLGNVRMVLTEEQDTDLYPAATIETATRTEEVKYYAIQTAQVKDKSQIANAGSYSSFGQLLYKVNGGVSGQKTGLGMVLKVMTGDQVSIRAESFYNMPGGGPGSPLSIALTELLGAFAGSSALTGKGLSATDISGIGTNTNNLNNLLNTSPGATVANAHLNWVLFDDQFRYVTGDVDPVQTNGGYKNHTKFINAPVNVSKSGYLYIFVSNKSNLEVFFDNLTVTHVRGPILEETHYYPFGLTMAGISSKAVGKLENKYKFNGIEQSNEFDINIYDAFYRNFDPQIGRWCQIDPKPNDVESPYAAMGNNPILHTDFLGDTLSPAAKALLVEPRNKDGDQRGLIRNAPEDMYETSPVTAFGMDVGHLVAEYFGINAADNFIANRNDGQNSVGEIVEDAAIGAVSTARGGKAKSGRVEIVIDGNSHPEAAAHAQDAINSGIPAEGVIDRAGAKSRRAENLRNVERKTGQDRDEFPPAVINNGGNRGSVRHISPSDNRGAGASVGAQIRNLPDNTRVVLRVIPEVKKK